MELLKERLFSLLVSTLGLLSLTWQRRLGRLLGSLAWALRLDGARVTEINLTRCFPGLDAGSRTRLARASLQHSAMLLTELGALHRWPDHAWQRLVVATVGESLLPRDHAPPGTLLLVPHLGNWEFLALVLGRYGITALYDPPRQAALAPLLRTARSRAGTTMLPIDPRGLRAFYQTLASGGLTALLPDQVPERRAGVYADFFGWPALTMTFAHRLIQRTGARVLIGAALRCPGGFRVIYSELDDAVRSPDPQVSAAAMNQAIETLVRTDPAQYQWEYKRFKRPPRGGADPYRP